jgi:hypothetical protein
MKRAVLITFGVMVGIGIISLSYVLVLFAVQLVQGRL